MDDAVTALGAQRDELAAFVTTARAEDLARPSRATSLQGSGPDADDVLRLMRAFA